MNDSNPPSDAKKKCLACGYEGVETVCPSDNMVMEAMCQTCGQCMSICVCEKAESTEKKEEAI